MNAKITLYSDENLIKEIKDYAKRKNTSVSKLVNEFFKSLLENEKGLVTDSLVGILDKGDKKDYYKYLEKKYL